MVTTAADTMIRTDHINTGSPVPQVLIGTMKPTAADPRPISIVVTTILGCMTTMTMVWMMLLV